MANLTKEQMLEAIKNIDPFYIWMLERIHPIFGRNLSIAAAGAELGVSDPTARRVWKEFLAMYPMVEKTMKDYKEREKRLAPARWKVRYPSRCGDLTASSGEAADEGTVFGEKIVGSF